MTLQIDYISEVAILASLAEGLQVPAVCGRLLLEPTRLLKSPAIGRVY